MNSIKRFLMDEAGAVTVDWVVLTSGVVILAVIVMPPIQTAVVEMAMMIRDQVGVAGTWLESVPD
jgi:Flp pilus assembly pilin Flp